MLVNSQLKITVDPVYDKNGIVLAMFPVIKISRREEGSFEFAEFTLRVESYDILPDDKEQRKAYYRELIRLSNSLIAVSGAEKAARARRVTGRIRYGWRPNALVRRKKAEYFARLTQFDNTEGAYAGHCEHIIWQPHKMTSIFPVQKKEYLGVQVLVPANPEEFAALPVGTGQEEAYANRLEALGRFDRLCEKNQIQYTVMGMLSSDCSHYEECGEETKLAAWQIGLMREDYEKAVALLDGGTEDEALALVKNVRYYPQVHSNHVGFLLDKCAAKDPWQSDLPIELYPFDPVPDDYVDYQKLIRASLKDYRRHRSLINGQICKGYDKKQQSTDTWAEYEKMEKDRAAMAARYPVGRRVFTVYNNRPHIRFKKDLFPPVRRKLDTITVTGPANPYSWHEKKDNAYTEYLAKKKMPLIEDVNRVCADLGIEYFTIANLLIGAAIYHDFVPESDNRSFDICFLRPDYEKFIAYMRKSGSKYNLFLSEYRDNRKKLPHLTKSVSRPEDEGSEVCLRILPFDKSPEEFYMRRGFIEDMQEKNGEYQKLLDSYNWSDKNQRSLTCNPFTECLKAQYRKRSFDRKALSDSLKQTRHFMFANPVKEAAALDRYAQQFNDDDRTKTWQRTAFQLTKPIPEDMLFPIQKQPFGDVMVSCPNDYSVWQPMLNEELERQVSSIQKADLILLRELDRVCTLLGIKYFVCGGTMLGYVRHGGFIPWDDDVDVAMLRSDYNRFISEAGAVLDKRVFLQTRDTDPNIPYLFSKIRLNDTEYVTEYNEFRDFHKGICLDIFPFDFLPDEPKKCQDFIQEVIGLSKQHNGTANHQYAIEQSDIVPRNEREANYLKTQKEKLDMYWAQDLRISQQAYIEAATRYNADAEKNELTIVASFIPSFTYIDLNDLFPLQRGMFEDVEVSLPRRPEVFLKMQYGDFMKLPPKHQQIAHRLVRWSTWEAHGGKEQESAT